MKRSERGAALLAVLILVAITGAIAAAALEKLRLSRAVSANVASLDQARFAALGAEQLAMLIVDDLITQDRAVTTLAGGWNGATRSIPMPGGGLVEARVRDGGNCFNINSVVQGEVRSSLGRRPSGVAQFVTLMRLSGVSEAEANRIAEGAADWADTDIIASPGGAEDQVYGQSNPPFLAGNTLFAEVSELRVLPGMTPAIYARIRPHVCALPVSDLSPINVNTLFPHQALLVAMLSPSALSEEQVRRVLAARPAAGWANNVEFWRSGGFRDVAIPLDAQQQVKVRTDWFTLDIRSVSGDSEHYETALVDARLQPARIVRRRWERDGADALPMAR